MKNININLLVITLVGSFLILTVVMSGCIIEKGQEGEIVSLPEK